MHNNISNEKSTQSCTDCTGLAKALRCNSFAGLWKQSRGKSQNTMLLPDSVLASLPYVNDADIERRSAKFNRAHLKNVRTYSNWSNQTSTMSC